MMQQMYRGQVVHTERYYGSGWIDSMRSLDANFEISFGHYRVLNPFVQFNFIKYPARLRHLQQSNLIQEISRNKALRCFLREDAVDYDKIVFISEKFGRRYVTLNKEMTHCYFSDEGKFFKSKIWVDKLGVIYGACAGSEYGVYDK